MRLASAFESNGPRSRTASSTSQFGQITSHACGLDLRIWQCAWGVSSMPKNGSPNVCSMQGFTINHYAEAFCLLSRRRFRLIHAEGTGHAQHCPYLTDRTGRFKDKYREVAHSQGVQWSPRRLGFGPPDQFVRQLRERFT